MAYLSKNLRSFIPAILFLSISLLINQTMQTTQAAPTAMLSMAEVDANEVRCLFDDSCTVFTQNKTAAFTFDGLSGSGVLQSQQWPRGKAGTSGHGLYPYLYRIDMRELVAEGDPACVDAVSFPFGPAVPLDYDQDGQLENAFVITSGDDGSITPDSIDLTNNTLTITLNEAVCSDTSPADNDGNSSFYVGLASPFRDREVTATVQNNLEAPHEVTIDAPDFAGGVTLTAVPSSGRAGDSVQLIGSGYVPGGYNGTIRWNGTDVETFDVPSGGAFSQPFTIPTDAAMGVGTITVCSLNPCATGEFEQLAEAPFEVTGIFLPYSISLPLIVREGSSATEPLTHVVDPTVQPAQESLPGLDGGEERPLTALRSPQGNVTTFVANELIIQTDSSATLNSFLARTGGEVLLEIDPAAADLTDLPKMYLVRVNLSMADSSNLDALLTDLAASEIESFGQLAFGDSDGVNVMAMAASEASSGLTVGVNWVSDTVAIPTSSTEAPRGSTLGGITYDPDATNWPHFAQGTVQDIGVPEAWSLLDSVGRLSRTIDVAVLDGGYFPNSDFPTTMTYLSTVPFVTDPRGVNGVDGRAPFHGTDVLLTVAAQSDNGEGIVGVAEPVARPIAVYTTYDYVVSIASVLAARAAGADIINMSYSADVPSIVDWTILPFRATTAALESSGVLLFASSGNDGFNVDGEDCFGVCWEHTFVTPCENEGVICVGGLTWNSQNRHPSSNFGASDVDIYAPFTVYRGESPRCPGCRTVVGQIDGTSFASPYAASVAALIWAADPSQSASEVWTTMRDTAHTSPDANVNRYVNAFDGVLEAIGSTGIGVELLAPAEGAEYPLGYSRSLRARVGYVSSVGGTAVRVEWRVDGSLVHTSTYNPGSGSHTLLPSASANNLSVGSHTVSVRVIAGSVVSEESATFTIVNTPPTVEIEQPTSGAAYCPGETINFRGSAFDTNEFMGLPNSAYAWRSSIDGNMGTGATLSYSSLSSGNHVITLRATDNQGEFDEDSINVTIRAASHPDCVDLSPTARIDSPENDVIIYADTYDGTYWYKNVTLVGTAMDVEDADSTLTVQWFSDIEGSLGSTSVNGSTGETSITAKLTVRDGCGTSHMITMRVTDSAGNISEDQIRIRMALLC